MSNRRRDRLRVIQQYNQNSSFLQLPPEIRNSIYEFSACNIDTVSVRVGGILYLPPLSLVCRQVREEFQQIYLDEAAKYATTMKIHLTNFVHTTATRNIANTYAAVPPPLIDVDRRYVLRIFLTNTFDTYLQHLRSLCFPPVADKGIGCPVEIRYDPKTFDVQYCQQLLPKMRWAIGGQHVVTDSKRDWKETEKGFEEAFNRYHQTMGPSNARKRKRR